MDETLVEQVVLGTGLSPDQVKKIIKSWVLETGRSPQGLKLEDLREVLVCVLQEVFAEVVSGKNKHISLSD